MTNQDNLIFRLERIYAAVGASKEVDLSKVPPQVVVSSKGFAIFQDFRGGLSDADLANIVHSMIQNIAGLKDHVKEWLEKKGIDPQKMFDHIYKSDGLMICLDLWNREKHPNLKRSYSKKFPKLENVNRVLLLTTKAEKGSAVVMQLTPKGLEQTAGSGSSEVVVTGDVVDNQGNKLGDIQRFASEAVQAWEDFLRSHGVSLR